MGWLAYWRCEPFGDHWRQAARITWATAIQYQRKGRKIHEDDFMPVKQPKRRMSDREIQSKFHAFFTAQKQIAEQHGRKSG